MTTQRVMVRNREAAIMHLTRMRRLFEEAPWPDSGYEILVRHASHKRSVIQNNLSHAWYEQVSNEEKEYSADEVKARCKLNCGVPILRGDDPDFNEFCMNALDHLTYEQKVQAMKYTPVTSLMNTKQMSRYLEDVQRNYDRKGTMLNFPDDY